MLTRYSEEYIPLVTPADQETTWAQETLNRLEFCTIEEAAAIVGKHPKTVYRLIEKNLNTIAFRKTNAGFIVYLPSICKHYGVKFNREQSR